MTSVMNPPSSSHKTGAHTDLPWMVRTRQAQPCTITGFYHIAREPDQPAVAYVIDRDDAEKVVRAFNAHDGLIEALNTAYVALGSAFNRIHSLPRTSDSELAAMIGSVRAEIEKATAKARGQS